jgi:Rrf2 family protein
MLLSKTSEHALRGLIYLATQTPGKPSLGRDVAEHLGASVQYVTGILRRLAKRGVLISVKGKGGGFVLRPGAENMNILDMVEIVDGRQVMPHCVFSRKKCAKEMGCPIHCQWHQLKNQEMEIFRTQTIGSVARLCSMDILSRDPIGNGQQTASL